MTHPFDHHPLTPMPHFPGLSWQPLEADAGLSSYLTGMSDDERAVRSLCALDSAGQIVAYGLVALDAHPKQIRAYLEGAVREPYRRQGIGTFLLGWQEQVAREALKRIDDPRQKVMRLDRFDPAPDMLALYEKEGFQRAFAEDVLRYDLRQPLPAFSFPEGFILENWTAANSTDFHRVYEAAFKERMDGMPLWEFVPWRDAFTGSQDFRPNLTWLVRDGDQPVAYQLGWVEDGGGYIVQLGTHPAYRRQGLAGALVMKALHAFHAEGLPHAMLDVNQNNPTARRLYDQLGFTLYRTFVSYQKLP